MLITRMLHILSLICFILCLSSSLTVFAQEKSILDQYIEEGFSQNLILQQKNVSLEKAIAGLQEAKALFLPKADFSAGYLTGQGGRFIDIPVGDLLNPVYSTLNALLQLNVFPQIENAQQNFFPDNQGDIRVRTSMALYNSDIIHNKNIQTQQQTLKAIEIETYKRELAMQIKHAYYQYLMALENLSIYQEASKLVQQNVRVNESLLENGKGLPARVLRAQTELEQIKTQISNATLQVRNAQAYFNFLLNKPLDAPILKGTFDAETEVNGVLQFTAELDTKSREEFRMIATGKSIYEIRYKMLKQLYTPKVSAFADVGAQAERFKFNNKALYYLVGVQVDMPIFNRPQKYKIQQTQLDIQLTDLQYKQTQQQLELALEVAQNELRTSIENYRQSVKQLEMAATYFRLLDRGYQEGINTLIEYIDARNQLTNALTFVNINTYKVLQSAAAVERQSASYPINQ